MGAELGPLADLDYCYLTTTGRRTGKPHEIEIWFAVRDGTLYLMSGGRDRSDWVKNLRRTPEVSLRLGEETLAGQARLVTGDDEDELARKLLFEKYQPRYSGDLQDWRRRALPVAIDLA